FEGVIVVGAQKGERRDERTRADTSDKLELRPRPSLGPGIQESGSESAIVAATGGGEIRGRRQILSVKIRLLARPRIREFLRHPLDAHGVSRKEANVIWESDNVGSDLKFMRHSVVPRHRGAIL